MNTIHTHRNLRECSIPQVFKKQFTNPASLIRPLAGGYTEEPISEMIYPFVSEIGCDYRLDNDEQLNHVTCEQIQYFKPLAHTSQEGEINTAYVQVSQDLKLVSSVEESLPRPDESLNGRSIINIKFDFAGGDMQTFSESEVSAAFQNLLSDVTAAWTSVFQQNPVNFDIPDAYSPKTSKTIDLSGFLKHGLSEMFGGNLYVDIVYDPAFNILSMMRLSLNYHIRDHKYNIAEVTLDIKGFDLLMDVIMRKTDMTLSDLYALYKMAQGQGHAQGSSQGEEKVAKFQRNIIKAVNAIIDKELIAMVREAKNPQSGQPFSPEKFLHQLMAGMDVFKRFKNIEWISLQKILPTCAGLPMNMSVSVAGFNKIDIDLQSNLALFMGKVSPNVEATSSQSVIYATTMTGQLTIPIGGSTHSSGLQMRIGLNSERGARMRVKYGYDDLIVKTANPTKEKIEFYLQPILMSGDSKTSEQLLHADGRMFLLHHSGHEELSREAAFEKTYTRCLDSKKSLLLGRSFCVVAKYPDVKAVGWYELRFEYFVEQETGGALVDNLQFTHTGKGDMMSRLFNIHIKFNRQNRSLTVDSAFPEIEWNYQGDWTSYHSDTLYEYYYKDLISVKDHPYLGIILKKYIYLDGKDRQYIFNITHPSFGVDVRAEMHAENMEDKHTVNIESTTEYSPGNTQRHHVITYEADGVQKTMTVQGNILSSKDGATVTYNGVMDMTGEDFTIHEVAVRSQDGDQANPTEIEVEKTPDRPNLPKPPPVPVIPSIWDLPAWQTKLTINHVVKPIFHSEKALPGALEFVTDVTLKNPWNAGYRNFEAQLVFGYQIHTTFKNFHFWSHGDGNVTYTSLSGAPTPDTDGSPLLEHYCGNFNIHRVASKTFDFAWEHSDPSLEYEFVVGFDWDAYTHHKPLYFVRAHMENKLQFLNEENHKKHSLAFNHAIFNITMDTDYMIKPLQFTNNGSVSLQVFGKGGGFSFENKLQRIPGAPVQAPPMLVCEIRPNSQPVALVYSFMFTGPMTVQMKSSMIMPGAKFPVLLWTMEFKPVGSSIVFIKVSWEPSFDQKVLENTQQRPLLYSRLVSAVADHVRGEINKPIMEKNLPFTEMSLSTVAKTVLGPYVFKTVMEAHPAMKAFEMAHFLALKTFSKAYLVWVSNLVRGPKMKEVLDKRSYTVAFDMHVNLMKQGLKESTKQIWGTLSYNLAKVKPIFVERKQPPALPIAMVTRHHDGSGDWIVQTYKDRFLSIPAMKAKECTYLLLADASRRQYSLVLSPVGVTVVTPETSISIGWDKRVTVDNCKLERKDGKITSGGLTVVTNDDLITLTTNFGLKVFCDRLDVDSCHFYMTAKRNSTIGLFGINDGSKYTDMRLLNGQITSDTGSLLAAYAVAGPSSCYEQGTNQQPDCEAVCKATPCSDGDDKVCKVVANLVRKCKIQLQIAEEFMPQADVAKDSAPYKYLLGLLLTQTDGWEEFSDVRLGIVTFGGDAKEEDYGFENLANVWADGDKLSDGFEALRLAAQFPFRPTAHKIAVLIMTKEQSSGSSDDLNTLSSALTDQGIVLNVFSTYAKTSSRRIMGINWEENIITKQDGYQDIKDMPNNDYVILIKETKGALWDLNVVKNGRDKQLNRVVDEFVAQTRRDNAEYCPAA
ncbi:hypothetical protein MAR_037906 [Mya arenaria]|uniref:VWFD domain-containing protein n=1 Tax=Mya arenaria TaxID=6604 RepID=A0ABY7FT88_MYAAR|nr:hypothetical protein MAR_037906 [Mya arenaria]